MKKKKKKYSFLFRFGESIIIHTCIEPENDLSFPCLFWLSTSLLCVKWLTQSLVTIKHTTTAANPFGSFSFSLLLWLSFLSSFFFFFCLFFLFVVKSIRNRFILLIWKKKKPIKKMVDGVVVDGRPLNLFLSLFFSACPVLLFATLREEEPCICLREREKDHSFAYSSAMSSRKKEKKKSHSAVLSLLFSPWVRSLSFFFFSTRFSFVLWGQCNEIRSYPIRSVPPLLLKENNKTKDGRIRKFLFIFKHLSSGQKLNFAAS